MVFDQLYLVLFCGISWHLERFFLSYIKCRIAKTFFVFLLANIHGIGLVREEPRIGITTVMALGAPVTHIDGPPTR